MASPLNNPWISGSLGVATTVYLLVVFTPEAWKRPIRDFLGGELKREGGREPELKTGMEKMYRARPEAGPDKLVFVQGADQEAKTRRLFREIPKRTEEKKAVVSEVPEPPAGAGLRAVWVDGETRVAVMTDGMVREGEPWGMFTVETITPEAVTLRHEAGERVLRLGEVRVPAGKTPAKAGGPVVATAPQPAAAKPAEGSPEAQLQKLMEMQKAMDPAKMMQGIPQKLLDAIMGKPKAPPPSP
jgi:hypothetical protein